MTDGSVPPEESPQTQVEAAGAEPMAVDPQPEAIAPKPRRRGRRLLIAAATVIALLGASVAAVGLYLRNTPLPDMVVLPESTTLYFADGKTVLARLGEVLRYELRYEDFNDAVTMAAVAEEDPEFWTSSLSGMTRSVVRLYYDLGSAGSTGSRMNETALAWRMEQEYPKEQILQLFLNGVGFGRSTYGIEAAAQAFFGKTANKARPEDEQLTTAEAMLLMVMVKQPNPSDGSDGYDPTYSEEAKQNAVGRWEYLREQMVRLNSLSAAEAAAMTFPTTVKKQDAKTSVGYGLSSPTGLIVNHVLDELTHDARSPLYGWTWQAVREGGFDIVTTIDHRVQKIVIDAAARNRSGSVIYGQPANVQAAAVVTEPNTGRVLGYFGGEDGSGADYAGIFQDDSGEWAGFGAHPPGASFFPHTLAAALKEGISLRSQWNWAPHDMPGRVGANQVQNTSACTLKPNQSPKEPCTLLNATTNALNVPFYEVTVSATPAKVLQTARDAGIQFMWNDSRQRKALAGISDFGTVTPSTFGLTVGLGQYPVTVLDQAGAMATYAASGRRAVTHFVRRVRHSGSQVIFDEKLPAETDAPVLSPEAAADLSYALSQNPAGKLPGRPSASAVGSWGLQKDPTLPGDAWIVGYTPYLAMAVWVGNKAEVQALRDKHGQLINGAGLPAIIYREVMTSAHEELQRPRSSFPEPANAGRVDGIPGSASVR